MKLLSAAAFTLLVSNISVAGGSNIRGTAGLEKEMDMQHHSRVLGLMNVGEDAASPFDTPSNVRGYSRGNGKSDNSAKGNVNGNGKNEDPMPAFLSDDELPPGLVANPSLAVGVGFKTGKKPRGQKIPGFASGKTAVIRGMDNKPIILDIDASERINVYHPDEYALSNDGTYVTENETGEKIPLSVFFTTDHKDGFEVLYSLDEHGNLATARVTPKAAEGGDGPRSEEAFEVEMEQKGTVQNFQVLEGYDILVGYMDDDVDLAAARTLDVDEADQVGEENVETVDEGDGWNNQTRRLQRTDAATAYGRTCSAWDFLTVKIATDRKFRNRYSDHRSRAQAIFAEAQQIYWKESCVWIYMLSYESTVGNSNWITPNGAHIDTRTAGSSINSGCNNYGLLDIFQETVRAKRTPGREDAWHLFTGANMWDAAGCAYVNRCSDPRAYYGVNEMTWTTNLRYQAVEFAHELGHNLGLNHLGGTWGRWVMEPRVNFAPYDLHPSYADYVRNKVVFSSSCGWY